jgi:erythronate-4-phosphate dehydrogenase
MTLRHGVPLSGKTMGIIGVGNTGKKVETLARLLGMKVLLNDPPRARTEGSTGFVSLEKLLYESDIVTLHVPLNRTGEDKSLHLVNEATLKWVKRGAWLINSSRGEVVDEPTLKKALTDGTLSGAVLDVWENEPAIDLQLLEKVTLATPHIAGYSTDGKRNGTVHMVRSLAKHFYLPLKEWEPSDIPEPKSPFIVLDSRDQTMEKIVCQAILHTYDVTKDDVRFRASPGDFERLRNIYPLRREFPAYSIILLNDQSPVKEKFLVLGFSVL